MQDTISSDSVPEITEKLLFSSMIATTHREKKTSFYSPTEEKFSLLITEKISVKATKLQAIKSDQKNFSALSVVHFSPNDTSHTNTAAGAYG